MIRRKAVSPFISTLILVAITVALGAFLYGQFQSLTTSQARTASITVLYSNVGSDGKTYVLTIKNDGNTQLTLKAITLSVGGSPTNVSYVIIAGNQTGTFFPGEEITVQFTSTIQVQPFTHYTVTVITDKVAKSFDLVS